MNVVIPALLLGASCFAQPFFPSGLTRFAGRDTSADTGDNGPAYYAVFRVPSAMSLDAAGNIYISESGRIRKIDARGTVTTIFAAPGVGPSALDAASNLYIAQGGNIIKIAPGGGTSLAVTRVNASAIAIDSKGQLYFAEPLQHYIRVIRDSAAVTVATGIDAFALAFDAADNLYAAASTGVFKIDASGAQTKLASGPASAIAIDPAGNLLAATPSLVKITPAGAVQPAFANTCGVPTSAVSLRFDAAGNLYVLASRLVQITPAGKLTTIAGAGPNLFTGDGGPAATASFAYPSGLAFDAAGRLYVADTNNNRVRVIDSTGIVRTVAGDGGPTYDQDPTCLPDRDDFLRQPRGVALDAGGNLYIADSGKNRVRRIAPDGAQSTIGSGFQQPTGLAVDAEGNVFVADTGNQRVVRIAKSGASTSLNMTATGSMAFDLSGGLLIPAGISLERLRRDGSLVPAAAGDDKDFQATAVAVDSAGSIYTADLNSHAIQRTSPNCHISSDGAAQIQWPTGLAFDARGSLYIADGVAGAIWKATVTPAPATETPTPRLLQGRPLRSAAPSNAPMQFEPDHFGGQFFPQEPIAPGELVRITGACIGPFEPAAASFDAAGNLPNSLGGVQVTINNAYAPLLSVSEGDIVAVAPNGLQLASAAASAVVVSNRGALVTGLAPVTAATPALFTANLSPSGPALAVNQDGTLNSAANPARRGSIVLLYGTGFGKTMPPSADGQAAPVDQLQLVAATVTVSIGGVTAEVLYSGNAPGFAGLTQLNVRVPPSLAGQGAQPIVVGVGSVPLNQGIVTLFVN